MARPLEHDAPERVFAELSVDESLALLEQRAVGRLVWVEDDEPYVIPLNYLLHAGTVLFRTTWGAILDAVASGAKVAFEIDDIDPAKHAGWSVVVHGRAEEVWEPAELEEVRQLPLQSWAPGERTHYVRIFPAMITGRRIR